MAVVIDLADVPTLTIYIAFYKVKLMKYKMFSELSQKLVNNFFYTPEMNGRSHLMSSDECICSFD